MIIAVSAIIATKDRPDFLQRTIKGLLQQSCVPMELIIIDASQKSSRDIFEKIKSVHFKITYIHSERIGAASQRIQGLEFASQPIIWFLDDDIILEEVCTQRLWNGFHYSDHVGAVNAMITNQRYTKPGRVTRFMYRIMHGKQLASYAGKIIGPAWNLLPEDEPNLPDYVQCEWLNTTCTMYKREALPSQLFSDFFTGYSLFEDLALSVTISKRYTLLNARTARIFHDSQPGSHKNNIVQLSQMMLVNRYYVMTNILGRHGFFYNLKLFMLETFGLVTGLRSGQSVINLPKVLWGKFLGIMTINKLARNSE